MFKENDDLIVIHHFLYIYLCPFVRDAKCFSFFLMMKASLIISSLLKCLVVVKIGTALMECMIFVFWEKNTNSFKFINYHCLESVLLWIYWILKSNTFQAELLQNYSWEKRMGNAKFLLNKLEKLLRSILNVYINNF